MKRFLPLLLLVSCAPVHTKTFEQAVLDPVAAEYRTRQGMLVFAQEDAWLPAKTDVEAVLDDLLRCWGAPDTGFSDTAVTFVRTKINCPWHPWGSGCTRGLMALIPAEMNWRQAFRHEGAHILHTKGGWTDRIDLTLREERVCGE